MDFNNFKFLVVGSGFFGSTIAERLSSNRPDHILVIDKRDHIGGNCYSEIDNETNIEYHTYGTHIFHTSNKAVWNYIQKFTEFNGYRHQVLTTYRDKVYQMPINLETINSFFELNLKPYEVEAFVRSKTEIENIKCPKNLEEKAIATIGRELYEAFIKGYTIKQWRQDPKTLPEEIFNRIPIRTNYNENYFFDIWQGVPLDGYTQIFKRMLSRKNITILLKTDFFNIIDLLPKSCKIIFTGPIDQFFDYKYGQLEWRSLSFEKLIVPVEDYQGTAVMNYSEESIPFTRIHEPRHLHLERKYPNNRTLILKEYSKQGNHDNLYYPVNTPRNQTILKRYQHDASQLTNIYFGGRLGSYQYFDMDAAIKNALYLFENELQSTQTMPV